jgi:Pectate lyase superfamily protein
LKSLNDPGRRLVLSQLAGVGAAATTLAAAAATGHEGVTLQTAGHYDAKEHFQAAGNGSDDDTRALQNAVNQGAADQRPIVLPPGVYKITRPLMIPPNTILLGSAPGLGFGCRLEPSSCPAFVVGGKETSFHCAIENIMIWPKGAAPDFIICVDNSYSITFRNIRIHNGQQHLARAAILLLGDPAAGGHGRCNNVIWENLVVRNDSGQPGVAVLASRGCGSHRFIAPDLENYAVLFEWQGGQIDLIAPYTERAGRYAVNCDPHLEDEDAYLNTFGGIVEAAASGIGCAIRSNTRCFNSFGTIWGRSAGAAGVIYSLPASRSNFYGLEPNFGSTGKSRFSGVPGWRRFVSFPDASLVASRTVDVEVAPHGLIDFDMSVPCVVVAEYWATAVFNADLKGVQLNAFVSKPGIVTAIARNQGNTSARLSGVLTVICGIAQG